MMEKKYMILFNILNVREAEGFHRKNSDVVYMKEKVHRARRRHTEEIDT